MSEAGDQLEPVEFQLTEKVLRDYLEATGTSTAGDQWRDGRSESEAPPTLASVYTYGVIAQLPTRRGAILAGQRFRFHRPLRVEDRLVTEARVAERYERRSRQYMVLETETRDQEGNLVCEGRLTRILPDELVEEGP